MGADNRVKLQFVTLGHHDHYEALKATILNRTEGEVDSLLFRFSDVWGKKPVSNPNFSEGVIPHLWTCDGETKWYVYRPSDADLRKLADEVKGYLDVFIDRSVSIGKERPQREGKASVAAKLRAGKKVPAPHEPVAKNEPPRVPWTVLLPAS
jgi:hypothetical protein